MSSTYLQPDAAKAAGLEAGMAIPYIWDEDAQNLRQISHIQSPEAVCSETFSF